jgi:hypothetical protein
MTAESTREEALRLARQVELLDYDPDPADGDYTTLMKYERLIALAHQRPGWVWVPEDLIRQAWEDPRCSEPLYRGAAPQPPAGKSEPATCPHGIRLPHECRDCQERLGKIELAVIRVCGEMRDEAHERRQSDKDVGMFPDEHTAQLLTEWANSLELTNTHLLEDIYEQCCEAIKPHVDAGRLPASLVESVQKLADAIPREIHERLIRDAKREALREAAEWFKAQEGRTGLDAAIDAARKESP